MAEPNKGRDGGAHHIHIEKKEKKFNWLPWLLAALGLLALLFALTRCDRDEEVAAVTPTARTAADSAAVADPMINSGEVVAATPNAAASDALAGTAGLGTYLAGTEPTPRTFVFEKLNFDTSKSAVRAEDAAEVDQVAAALTQHANARIRIAGYADARGSDAANIALGKARAESIKAALVAKGVEAGRIETVSGGENEPVDSNATEKGRFENRRTELVVTAR